MDRRKFMSAIGLLFGGCAAAGADDVTDSLAAAKALREAAAHRVKPKDPEPDPPPEPKPPDPTPSVTEPAPPKAKVEYYTRPPVGHTHSCKCGTTWDHTANPTHTCLYCGTSQFVVDNPPRPVTMQRVVGSASIDIPSSNPSPATYIFPGSSSAGCPNGQCGIPAATYRRGLFR